MPARAFILPPTRRQVAKFRMSTFADIDRYFTEETGFDPVEIQTLGRYARKENFRSGTSRKGLPQVETVHGVFELLKLMVGGRQVNATENARALFWLPAYAIQRSPDPDRGGALNGVGQAYEDLPFGPQLMWFVEQAISPIPEERDGFDKLFEYVSAWEGRRRASIQYTHPTPRIAYYQAPLGAEVRRPLDKFAAPMERLTVVPRALIGGIAQLVAHSRREAQRLGVSIPTDDIWRALGPDPARSSSAPPAPTGAQKSRTPAPRQRVPAPTHKNQLTSNSLIRNDNSMTRNDEPLLTVADYAIEPLPLQGAASSGRVPTGDPKNVPPWLQPPSRGLSGLP